MKTGLLCNQEGFKTQMHHFSPAKLRVVKEWVRVSATTGSISQKDVISFAVKGGVS